MKTWRMLLAVLLIMGSYLGLYWAELFAESPAVQALFFILALVVGIIALTLAQDDGWYKNNDK